MAIVWCEKCMGIIQSGGEAAGGKPCTCPPVYGPLKVDLSASVMKCAPNEIDRLAAAIGSMDAAERKNLTDEITRLDLQVRHWANRAEDAETKNELLKADVTDLKAKLSSFRDCCHQFAPEECQSCLHNATIEKFCKVDDELRGANRLVDQYRKALEHIGDLNERIEPMTWIGAFSRAVEIAKAALADKPADKPAEDFCSLCKKKFLGTFTELKAAWCEDCSVYVCSLCRTAHNVNICRGRGKTKVGQPKCMCCGDDAHSGRCGEQGGSGPEDGYA